MVKEQFGTTTPVYNKLFYNSRGQLAEIRESTSYTGPTDTNWNRGAIINHYSEQCWGMCGGNNSTSAMTDNNGNLRKQEVYIPNDDQISGYTERWQQYDYDSLNRLNWVREIKDNVEQWKQQFTYDRWGNRTINTGVTYGVGINNRAFTVDAATNRLTVPTGQSGVMSYDVAGNLTNDTYTGAGNRTYDGENKITSATGSSTQTEVYAYDTSGQRIKRTVDGIETWQIYGLGGELVAEYAANGAVASPQKEYGYRNGQLLVTAEPATGPQNVTWTNATGVSISGNSLTKTAVDDWYNCRASSTQSLSAGDGYVEFTASENNTYRMVGLGEYGTGSFTYSNLRYMFYLAGGVLSVDEYGSATNVGTYATGDTLRVGIEAGVVKYRKNGTVVYTSPLAPVYPLYADATLYTNGSTLSNVKFSSGSSGAKIQWLISDQLGTPRMVLDQTGSLAAMKRHDYLPFGEELFAPSSGRTATQGYASGDGVRQQFTSKERDNETGLDYFLARYYSSMQGRFTGVDPQNIVFEKEHGRNAQERSRILQSYLVQPQNWNRYAYTRNNPLAYTDPNGRCSAPSGLSKRNVGICIEAFIATPRIGSGAIQGVGDNRTFAANDPTKTNRIELRGTITPGRDASGWSYDLRGKANVSKAVTGVVELRRQGTLDLEINTTSIDKDGNAHLAITMTGVNGFSGFPGAPAGAITLNVNLVITPDGKVGIEGGERTAYPSVGIYAYTIGSDGQPRTVTLGEGNETTIDALTKPTVPIQPVAPTCNCEKKREDEED